MRTFRGKEVIGWKVVSARSNHDFEEKLNKMMDEYEFIDTQYAREGVHSAIVLIAKK